MPMGYDSSFEFLTDLSYGTDVTSCMSTDSPTYASQEYNLDPKSDFSSFYNKTDLVSLGQGFASSYLAAMTPAYRM